MTSIETRSQEIAQFLAANRNDEALRALRRLIAERARASDAWGPATRYAQALGDAEAFLAAARRFAAAAPDDMRRATLVVRALLGLRRLEETLSACEALGALEGGAAPAALFQGVALSMLGRAEASIASLRRALELEPRVTHAWTFLAAQKTYPADDPDIAALEAARAARAADPPAMRLAIPYSLFKAYDDIGERARAWASLQDAFQLHRQVQPFDVARLTTYYDRLQTVYVREYFENRNIVGHDDPAPVFICGPPRSGTTLLERILSTHGDVAMGGEHGLARTESYRLGEYERSDLEAAYAADKRVFADFGRDYVAAIRRRFGDSARITDKTLNNVAALGVIAKALPAAKFVWIRRDLRDTVWSCLRTWLDGNLWSETPSDAVRYVAAYEKFMGHWREMLGERLHVIDYERLVAAPDEVLPPLYAHLGLAYDEAWRGFHNAPGHVATASLAQVRRPLNDRSIGGWKKYQDYLTPYFGELEKAQG